jgi:hypothetical protein
MYAPGTSVAEGVLVHDGVFGVPPPSRVVEDIRSIFSGTRVCFARCDRTPCRDETLDEQERDKRTQCCPGLEVDITKTSPEVAQTPCMPPR